MRRQSFKEFARPLFSLILAGVLLFSQMAFSVAEFRETDWTTIQQSLDCDGSIIEIDAVVDCIIPTEANEWQCKGKIWTEAELRELLAVISPANIGLERHPHNSKDDISLYNNNEEASISANVGYVLFDQHNKFEPYSYAANSAYVPYFKAYEPFVVSIEPLELFSYDDAMAKIQPLLNGIDCEVGRPFKVLAWNQEMLQSNWETYKHIYSEIGNKQWTIDDEIYQITLPVYFKGIRLDTEGGPSRPNINNTGARIDVVLNSSDILHFETNDILMEDAKAISKSQPIISLEEAIECYRQYRSNMLVPDEESFVVNKILLQYIVLKDSPSAKATYRLVPAWCFFHEVYADNNSELVPWLFYEPIHAITGLPVDY